MNAGKAIPQGLIYPQTTAYDGTAKTRYGESVLLESGTEQPPEDDEQGMFEHFRMNVDPGQTPVRVDKYMACHLGATSRHRVQVAIKNGCVRVNDKVAKANLIIRPGDVIRFVMPYERHEFEVLPENIPLDIIYEDDDFLIVNKPAGMVVHPGHGHFNGTLVNAIAYHLGLSPNAGKSMKGEMALADMPQQEVRTDFSGSQSRGTGAEACDCKSTEDDKVSRKGQAVRDARREEDGGMGILVHRIDMDTSGLLVVAKNDESQLNLAKQFFVHSIERKYFAVVWGNIKEDEGKIEGNIGRDPNDRLRFRVCPDGESGKPAVTHYKVLERFGFVTVVECTLETGRTHQIRVHMNYIGHPVFNDARYGGNEIRSGTVYTKYRQFIRNCFELCPRQALHARTLGFTHPRSGKFVLFDSPVPADISALIEKWRIFTASMKQ